MLEPIIHYSLHFILPIGIAYWFYKNSWKKSAIILLSTNLVDLDHIFAYPNIFVANRCSINFHPLHTYEAMGVYFLLLFFPKYRLVGIGLLLHMLTDSLDCWMMSQGRAH